MAIITVKTDLLTPNQEKKRTLGTLIFIYDDSKAQEVKFEGTVLEPESGFLLIKLSLQFNEGIFVYPKFKQKTSFDFSARKLQALNLIYIKPKKNEKTNLRGAQKSQNQFYLGWNIPLDQVVSFVVKEDGVWAIDLGSEDPKDTQIVYGSFGVVQIVPEQPKPEQPKPEQPKPEQPKPVPPKSSQFPNQSPPVNRRTIFDPNQHNADPVVALGSDPNDSMRFSEPINCGCYVLSGISLTRCLAVCGR